MTISNIGKKVPNSNLDESCNPKFSTKTVGKTAVGAKAASGKGSIDLAESSAQALSRIEKRQQIPEEENCEGSVVSSKSSAETANKYDVKICTVQQLAKGHQKNITELRSGGTRAWRNNNPGNIRNGKFADNHGAIGEAGGFAVFPDEVTGESALVSLLKTTTYQNLSIDEAVARYAPPSENDTQNYKNFLKDATGLAGTTQLNTLSDDQLRDVVKGIRRIEGWKIGDIKSKSDCISVD
ncbi:MAG: hypothetical protein H7A32_00960 [Deltaproteobacteria bacterium]|nr:hypothetical protein [Deltaproteobacteria bacterium]